MNTIWIEDPDKAREYGIPPEGLSGSVEMGAAVWSKDPCADPKLERLRQRAPKTGAQTMICLILIPLIVLGLYNTEGCKRRDRFSIACQECFSRVTFGCSGCIVRLCNFHNRNGMCDPLAPGGKREV